MSHQMSSSTVQSGPRVLLYERQALVRQGLRCLLEHTGFRVVAEAADGCDLVYACHTRPDVVVAAESCDRVDLTELLEVCTSSKVVVLVDGDGVNQSELERLSYAVVSKDADATTLGGVVRRVCGETRRRFRETPHMDGSPNLKARDWEVLRLLAMGRTNKEIGSALGVTEKTVRQRLTGIFASIEVRNRTEAALYALGHRDPWVEAQPESSAA